jgi:hypothetical protein
MSQPAIEIVSKNKTERGTSVGLPKTCPFHHVLPIDNHTKTPQSIVQPFVSHPQIRHPQGRVYPKFATQYKTIK